MTNCAEGDRVAHPSDQTGGGGASPTSALCLRVEPCEFLLAKRLNAAWHSRMPRLGTGCIVNMPFPSFAAVFDGRIYAVAIWSNPVSRLLPQRAWMELRRLAIAPDAPRNTASRMLAVMTRLLRRERPHLERLISYQDTEAHTGAIYRAAGWTPADVVGSQVVWSCPSRFRPASQSTAPKVRWEKPL